MSNRSCRRTHRIPYTPSMSDDLIRFLAESHHALVCTGAGISTGSGIPDFRGPSGVWKTRKPVLYQDFMTSESSRIEHWEYKLEGWSHFQHANPNAIHHAIAKLEQAGKLLLLVTQNIDGLHTQAGTSAQRLVEIHGTNSQVECQTCFKRYPPEPQFEYFRHHRKPPQCPCGGFLKLATISFGQALREDDLDRAYAAADEADFVIALGSTLSVQPAASIPLVAAERGIPYVIINRGPTDQDNHPAVTLRLDGDIADLFPPAVSTVLT